MTRYDFRDGAQWNQSFPIVRRQFPSRFHCIWTNRRNREPNLAKKRIGQKKAIRRSQVFQKFYDDAIEVLLKFCVGMIKVL